MKPEVIISLVTIAVFAGIVICAGCQGAVNTQVLTTAAMEPEREVISLAGRWRFSLDPDYAGEQDKWYNGKLPDRIKLPGSTVESGYGDEISTDTKWTGRIIDKSWFTDAKYEKYRQPGSVKIPFWLTPLKHYVGPAWYQKLVNIPANWSGKRIVLLLERCHWETKVWVDGIGAGVQDSLCTPHLYDLSNLMTPGRHMLTIRVDNSMKYNVGVNAHSVSDHTQTNWNGIIGRMELLATDKIWLSDVQVYPDVRNKSAKLHVTIGSVANEKVSGTLKINSESWNVKQKHMPTPKTIEFSASKPETIVEVDYAMGDEVLLWDEFSPAMYKLTVSLVADVANNGLRDKKTVTFGMREFGTKGTQFAINDRLTFLRGTLECSIFPLTGYPDMSVEGWLRIIRVARAHGLNHMRFHSWCPPKAAFEAADRMGFMFHVECPAWTAVGDGRLIDKFIYTEGDHILKAYGNHPSFCMLAYGNEPGGKNQKRFLGNLINYWKDKDPRRLYTSAAGWPIVPESQFHSTPAPRGHQWGSGLRSRFNARAPETVTDYQAFVEKYNVPIVSHEIGQWCVYPNFKEIKKYTGVLRALNFEIFRDSLARNRMLHQAEDFLMASGKLQALLYKEEIETALRTPGFGGFQLLDIHDFPGQGTALVGILDPFWDSKGYIGPEEHNRYCSETVPLLRMKKRIWTTAETFTADAEIAHFGPAPIQNSVTTWSVTYPDGRKVASGKLPSRTIPNGNAIQLGKIELPLAGVKAPAQLSVTVSVKNTPYTNNWDIWVYPAQPYWYPPEGIIIAERLNDRVIKALDAGKKVLLMPPLNSIDSDIPAGFTTIFWNTQWTRKQPPHTLGILCNPKHPALAQFPTQFHSNWQWWDLVTKSKFMLLDNFPPDFRPIVQVIDDWNTNRKLGLLFEAKLSKGKLIFCSIDLRNNLDKRPVARQMLRSLLKYMDSPAFAPEYRIDNELVRSLMKKPSLLSNARVVKVDSEAAGHEGHNAIDGNPTTIWHTEWEGSPPGYPHQITIELEKQTEIKGITYLPRQDMSNGWIAEYEVYVSVDGKNWSDAVAVGTFKKGRDGKKILFGKIHNARFIRFVVISGFDGQIFASVAELDVIEASE
ncbi:MAG: discoidin domain-containing protein [Planctomycetota bacterium]